VASRWLGKPGAVRRLLLASLVPTLLVGAGLAYVLDGVLANRALSSARDRAVAAAGPAFRTLSHRELTQGVTRAKARRIRAYIRSARVARDVAGVRAWNAKGQIVYFGGALFATAGSTPPGVHGAVRGAGSTAVIDLAGSKDRLLETYVPIRPRPNERPTGVLEITAPYRTVTAALAADRHRLWLFLALGLGLLQLAVIRIVAHAATRFEREAAEKEHQALHDPLTGLPNRGLFNSITEDALSARKGHGNVAVVMLDLDRFKEINDALGHFNGDLVIERAAKRLDALCRGDDVVARLGGDEFAILLPNVRGRDSVLPLVNRVREALKEPFVVAGLALEVEASIGIAMAPENGEAAGDLLQAADIALYAAKRAHSGAEFYAPEQHRYSPAQLGLVSQLRRAIEQQELVLHYQPKSAIAGGQVEGVEALVRWQHRHMGLLYPDAFIPLTEHTSLIRPLTLHLLERALTDVAEWEREGISLSVAVNLSTQMLLDNDLAREVGRLLFKMGVPSSKLELEVTESSIVYDPRRASTVLQGLHDLGVRIAIDDFGTGYSSLVSLKQLPVSSIKIDKSFVMAMEESEDDDAIVRSTVELGRNLGLDVVAEGVETPTALARLTEYGCDYMQGYYLSKPLPAERLIKWLGAYRDVVAPSRSL
jgi:diguanylate cyclase (GGDEF)-like protein